MINFNNFWLMKPIAANYSSKLNWLAMMGVFSLRAKPIAAAENAFRRSLYSDSELLRYQRKIARTV